MAGSGRQLKALLKSHAERDDTAFYSVASQIAASAARQGHSKLAAELKESIGEARAATPPRLIALPPADDQLAGLAIESRPRVRKADLVLPTGLMSQIDEVIAEQLQRASLLDHGFVPAHRILLDGPPGTGKTLTASVLASELDIPLVTVRLDALFTRYLGETAGKLRAVFEAMEKHRAVYLFDEFDALGGDRSGNDIGEARRVLNSFLVMIEEVGPESVVVASTNHPESLDRALFRRFDTRLHYELPDAQQRQRILKTHLRTVSPRAVRWKDLASLADGLSHAELGAAAEHAAKRSILRGDSHVTHADLKLAVDQRRRQRRG